MSENNIKDTIKEKAAELRSRLEEIWVQLNLGEMDAADWFEKQKERIQPLLQQAEQELARLKDLGGEQGAKLSAALADLREKLAALRVETEDKLKGQSAEIEKAIRTAESALNETLSGASAQAQSLRDELKNLFAEIETSLDTARVRLHLASEELVQKWESGKAEVQKLFAEGQSKIEVALSNENLEKLKTDATETLNQVRDRLKSIFS